MKVINLRDFNGSVALETSSLTAGQHTTKDNMPSLTPEIWKNQLPLRNWIITIYRLGFIMMMLVRLCMLSTKHQQ